MKKVNLGSGPNGIEGWENLDWGWLPFLGKTGVNRWLCKWGILDKGYDWKWPKIRLYDIRKPLPYNDKSVDYIYCSHVLEHFEKSEVQTILKECYRVLKKNGILRVVLPDLKKMTKTYQGADKFCREFYGYNKDSFWWWKKMFVRGHQWMYDIDSITKLLKRAGFPAIKVWRWSKGNCPDLEKSDYREHRKISFYVEVVR